MRAPRAMVEISNASLTACSLILAHHAETFPFRGGGLLLIEGHKFQSRRIVFGCNESGTDLERIPRSYGVSFDNALGITADHLHRRYFGPVLPSAQDLPSSSEQPSRRTRLLPPPTGER